MSYSNPFAYNTGPLINGTIQVGDLSIGTPTSGFTSSPQYWNGPDQELGYVIGVSVSGNTQPTQIPFTYASVGFYRTSGLTDNAFTNLAQYVSRKNGTPQTFSSATEASIWLTNNGFWNSYPSSGTPANDFVYITIPNGNLQAEIIVDYPPFPVSPTPTPTPSSSQAPVSSPTPTPTITSTNTNTPTPTNTGTPTPTPTHSAPAGFTISIVESGGNVVMSASGSLNINDLTLTASGAGPLGGPGIGPNTATFLMGNNGNYWDSYSGFTSTPTNFGSGFGSGADSSSGDVMGVTFQGAPPYELNVPVGYTTGTAISSTQTFSGQTFTSLGLVEGTYTYSWGSGGNADSINVVIGTGGVTPTPTSTSVTPTPTPTSGATGNFNVTISQQGPDVVWFGSGSFNLSALSLIGTQTLGAGYQANSAIWAIGPSIVLEQYGGASLTYPTSIGPGGTAGGTANSGSTFGILPGGASGRILLVPSGYTSNTFISGRTSYASSTIAGMGLSGGTYTWAWGSGGNASSLVMNIIP